MHRLYPGPRRPKPNEYWPRLMGAVEALDAMDAPDTPGIRHRPAPARAPVDLAAPQLWGIPTPAPPSTLAWMPFGGYSVSRYHQLHGLFNVPETHPRTPPAGRAPHADVLAEVLPPADPMALPRTSQAATAAAATLTATATRPARMRPTSQSALGSSELTPQTAAAGHAWQSGRR